MKNRVVAKKDKIPFFEKLMYGAGSGSFQIANDGVKSLANPIFNITLGLSPSLVGLVLMLSRVFDAFSDPIVGKWSDDTRSRFGRRRPFIFIGSFLTAAAFVAIWMVPTAWGQAGIFAYYLVAMLVFYFCATIQTVPYHTLGMEMTADTHERTVISAYKLFFSFIFALFLPWVFRLTQADIFGGVMNGMRFLSWFIALGILCGGVLPALFVKERYYRIAKDQAKVPLLRGMKMAFSNRSFVLLLLVMISCGIGGQMVGPLGTYIVLYYVYGGDLKMGAELVAISANVGSIASLACIPVMTWMAGRFGKVTMLKALIVLGVLASASKFFTYNQDFPYFVIITALIMAPNVAGYWTITTSMKADICDDDELNNGMRREGVFGAIGSWIFKATLSITYLLSGLILELTGFHVSLGGNQSPETLLWMRLLFTIVPVASSLIALYFLSKYSLDDTRMAEIRQKLELRRAPIS